MAGSSTQSVGNVTHQGMKPHQMMMNAEVMNHLRIMNRASVREIMLQHEKTFKEQVNDLHKLYEVQRLLMDKANSNEPDTYIGASPPSPGHGNVLPEETSQGQRTGFWANYTPDGMGLAVNGGASTHMSESPPKPTLDRIAKVDEAPKNVISPLRKRKIDLEQLPEDDSDDEMENSANALNPTTSCLSRNVKELPKVYSGFDVPMKQGPGPNLVSNVQPLPPQFKPSQASSFLLGEMDMSREANQGKALPILPLNVTKTEQNFISFGDRNVSFQNAAVLRTGVGTMKNNTMFLPQADLIDRASQEAGRQAQHWFLQAPEPNVVDTSVRLSAQQQQRLSPHLALPEHSSSRSHSSTPHLEQRYVNNNSLWIENVGSSMGKVSLERQSPGAPMGAQKETSDSDASTFFSKESSLHGPLTKVVPMAVIENAATVGRHGMPGVSAQAFSIASNKGLSQEPDLSLWSSKNPTLQLPQHQQSAVVQQQIVPPACQSAWIQSSQSVQNSMYAQQQVVYGLHTSAPPQTGYRGESLQRNQGEMAGPWNVMGLGHYYSSNPSTPQKPPFKKPPKLVLKNDGVGSMELKLVSPEKETVEKDTAMQKKPLNVAKRDPLQTLSKSYENNSGVQKQGGEEGSKLSKWMSQIPNFMGEAKELYFSSSTLTLLQGASTSFTVPCLAQGNSGALACGSGTETGSGFVVSASPNEGMLQQCGSQLETALPSSEAEMISEQRISNLKTSRVASDKEILLQNNASAKDLHGQIEECIPLKGVISTTSHQGVVIERKDSLDQGRMYEGNAINGVASSQLESLNTTPQGIQSKCLEKNVVATDMVQKKVEEDKGSLSQPCAKAESYQKEFFECNASRIADSTGPADRPVLSVQSTNTDTPSTSSPVKKKRSSIHLDNDLSQRVAGRTSNACKNQPEGPLSDRDYAPAPSSTFMSEGESEAILNEDPQHDSDSDNLAASILLSFAPKVDLPNEEKLSQDNASEFSSNIHKAKPADQERKTFRSSEARIRLQSDYWNTTGSQGRRMQNSGSTRKVDRIEHHNLSMATVKDRHRREAMNYAERRTGEDDGATKSLTIKLPRVASGTSNDRAIPISKSKQLNKLNRVSLSGNPVESTKILRKGNEAVHTPTGRRSSRGPPMGARAPLESKSRLYQQTQHRVECILPSLHKDSGVREEGARSINKLEGSIKSKAWGELNSISRHPGKQVREMSHRKSQK